MMAADIEEVHEFVTQIEAQLRLHNIPAALIKCREAKAYIGVLKGYAMEDKR